MFTSVTKAAAEPAVRILPKQAMPPGPRAMNPMRYINGFNIPPALRHALAAQIRHQVMRSIIPPYRLPTPVAKTTPPDVKPETTSQPSASTQPPATTVASMTSSDVSRRPSSPPLCSLNPATLTAATSRVLNPTAPPANKSSGSPKKQSPPKEAGINSGGPKQPDIPIKPRAGGGKPAASILANAISESKKKKESPTKLEEELIVKRQPGKNGDGKKVENSTGDKLDEEEVPIDEVDESGEDVALVTVITPDDYETILEELDSADNGDGQEAVATVVKQEIAEDTG